MRKTLRHIAILMLFGCAQQVAPTGGPQDETPPKVLKEEPANLSTNFNEDRVVISFDEFIQLKSTAENVVISPPMLQPPTYQLKKKSLVVKFEQELASNTTYTINFGDAIADNNEGNILKNYTYVFSTGAHLDSMEVKGRLADAVTGEPEKDALVMLYKNDIDSLPIDTVPDYFTRTLEDGSFHIKNVADQPYKIFALKDENANYRFDVPLEKIGFIDSLILPFTSVLPIQKDSVLRDSVTTDSGSGLKKSGGNAFPFYEMRMFVEEDTTQFLKKAYCEYFGKLVFIYNRPVSTFSVQLKDVEFKTDWYLADPSTNADTVTIWTTTTVPDTLNLLLHAGTNRTDTVEVIMKPRAEEVESGTVSRGKGAKKKVMEKFALVGTFQPSAGNSPKPGEPLFIVWNHPVSGTDLSNIRLYEDSLRVLFRMDTHDKALRKFGLRYDWKKDRNYRLLVLDSAFTDIYGLRNDTIETTFKGSDKDQLGELTLKVLETPQSPLVIELMSSSNTVLDQALIREKGSVSFQRLNPGKYGLRVVSDENGNGSWDSGRYSQKLQPEPLSIIQNAAEVRANWTFELEWNPNAAKQP